MRHDAEGSAVQVPRVMWNPELPALRLPRIDLPTRKTRLLRYSEKECGRSSGISGRSTLVFDRTVVFAGPLSRFLFVWGRPVV